MTDARADHRRGLTLLETLLSVAITALIGGGILGMMAAVSNGIMARAETRSVLVRTSAGQARLAAYIAPARCLLEARDAALVLWLEDSRESDTVHATEIRWLHYDEPEGALRLSFIEFPTWWSETARLMADAEHDVGSDWDAVLASYANPGYVTSLVLLDGLSDLSVRTGVPDPLTARSIHLVASFASGEGTIPMALGDTIRHHDPPIR